LVGKALLPISEKDDVEKVTEEGEEEEEGKEEEEEKEIPRRVEE